MAQTTASLLLVLLVAAAEAADNTYNLLPIPYKSGRNDVEYCAIEYGTLHQCVHELRCKKFISELGGVLEEYELNLKSVASGTNAINEANNLSLKSSNALVTDFKQINRAYCSNKFDVCCPQEDIIQPPVLTRSNNTSTGCAVTTESNCPWCVKLYREGRNGNARSSGFFCMGTMVGSQVVLTTATCMLQASRQKVWARIPNSINPKEDYPVTIQLAHPQFNSGTWEYDVALMVLKGDVKWNSDGPKGACIGTRSSLQSECIGAGIDSNEDIDMTPLFVSKGACGMGGHDMDAACGQPDENLHCTLIPGAPVMCPIKDNDLLVVGIVRTTCALCTYRDVSLLGSFNLTARWLDDILQNNFMLNLSDYTQSV